jgi:hypothetical protein
MPKRIIDAHNHLSHGDDGSKQLELMDRCGIETSLIMSTPGRMPKGSDDVLKAVRRWPGRFIGGAFVDPREGKKAINEVKRRCGQGFRIVKLFPNFGYFPDDPKLRPFWAAVNKLRMGVLSHCGWLGGSGANVSHTDWAAYYSHPGRFEKVIRLFPDITFIMGHAGGIAGVLESVMLTTRTPNTFIDCSPGQGIWALEATGGIAASIPAEKILWGADSYEQAYVRDRAKKALVKLGFGPHLDKIFYSNARTLFEKVGALKKK